MLISPFWTTMSACLQTTVIVGICTAIAWPFARERHLVPLLCLLVFVALDTFALLIPLLFHWNLGHWNWTGKIASIILSLLFTRIYLSATQVGLRLPRSRSEILWTIVGITVAGLAAFPAEMLEPTSPPDVETYAFEATLPGIDEELAFRGIGLACLIKAFSASGLDKRGRSLALWVTAVWFAAVHVINLKHGHLAITWHRILDVFPYGIWFAIVRLKSGSLLGGVIAHNVTNLVQETLGAFRL